MSTKQNERSKRLQHMKIETCLSGNGYERTVDRYICPQSSSHASGGLFEHCGYITMNTTIYLVPVIRGSAMFSSLALTLVLERSAEEDRMRRKAIHPAPSDVFFFRRRFSGRRGECKKKKKKRPWKNLDERRVYGHISTSPHYSFLFPFLFLLSSHLLPSSYLSSSPPFVTQINHQPLCRIAGTSAPLPPPTTVCALILIGGRLQQFFALVDSRRHWFRGKSAQTLPRGVCCYHLACYQVYGVVVPSVLEART